MESLFILRKYSVKNNSSLEQFYDILARWYPKLAHFFGYQCNVNRFCFKLQLNEIKPCSV